MASTMTVYVESPMGNRWTVRGLEAAEATVGLLHLMLQRQCGIAAGRLALCHGGRRLNPQSRLCDYQMRDQAVVRMTVLPQTGL